MKTNIIHLRSPAFVSPSRELNRLVAAAVVSQRFRRTLLSEPMYALSTGYRGELFRLTSSERALVLSIRASSLEEFASKLLVKGQASNSVSSPRPAA